TTRYGVTPLAIACQNANAIIVTLLLRAGADPNASLPRAAPSDFTRGATEPVSGETALMTAARSGSVDVVRALLEAGADPNAREGYRGQTAIMWAAAEQHAAVITVLAAHGSDVNARSFVWQLPTRPQKAPDPVPLYNKGGLTPLHYAARQGAVAAALALVSAGADLDARDPN